jgi:hypothetical protein
LLAVAAGVTFLTIASSGSVALSQDYGHSSTPVIIVRPVSDPINTSLTAIPPTETTTQPSAFSVTARQPSQRSSSIHSSGFAHVQQVRSAVEPDSTDADAICGYGVPFAFTVGAYNNCYEGKGVLYPTNGAVWNLVNDAGVRVWLHQKADGTGWEDCFDYGQAYNLSGRDVSAKSLGVSTNSAACSPSASGEQCYYSFVPNAVTIGVSGTLCYYGSDATYIGEANSFLFNSTGYRVWLHQDLNGGGWADCFSNNNAYLTSGTRDDNPGNLYISANTSAC